MDESAGADGEEDAVAVDAGGAAVVVDGVHECGADEIQEGAGEVPGEVVARDTHYGAVGNTRDDEEDDEGEQADASFERRVVADELEKERDEVNGQESCCAGAGGFREKDEHDTAFEEFDREDAALNGCKEGESLLDGEQDEEDAGANEQADNTPTVPSVGRASEVDGHYPRNVGADDEDGSDVVDLCEPSFDSHSRTRVEARQEEEPDRGEDSSYT